MCSRPPTIWTSSHPAMTACVAWFNACKLLPHKRLIVAPPDSTVSPAINAILRATFSPCSPVCWVFPMMTSSISFGSIPVRSTSALTHATARSSLRTSRNSPLSLWARPIGVRTQSTTTALVISMSPVGVPPQITFIGFASSLSRSPSTS